MKFTDDALDDVFRALAHPTRRRLIERLGRGDATVGDLAEPFDVSLVAVSKHLSVLEEAGLLDRTPEGRYRRCRLKREPLRDATEWLGRQARFWTGTLDSLADYLDAGEDAGDADGAGDAEAGEGRP